MSGTAAVIVRLERAGDWCNAILVKETRQALKSRQFATTFLLLLFASWAGSLFGVAEQGDAIEYGSSAGTFFAGFFFVLSVACLVIVPFSAYRSVVEERAENTLELLQITALSPRQIVRGKSLSALVQVLVYYSAIAPFIAFTSLLPGFDIARFAFALVMLFVAALSFSMVALAIGSQARQKMAQAFSSLAVVGLAIFGGMGFYSAIIAVSGEIRFGDPQTWWSLALVVYLFLSTAFLCEQIAVAQLTFDSDNRSSMIRLIAVAQWLVPWLGFAAYLAAHRSGFAGIDLGGWETMVTITAIYITVAGVFCATEPDPLSRRVRRGLPDSSFLRFLWIPFLPGGARGLLYSLVSLAVLAAIASTILVFDVATPLAGRQSNAAYYAGALGCYSIIYVGAAAFFARFLRRVMPKLVAGHIFALLGAITIMLSVAGAAARFLLRIDDFRWGVIDLGNPYMTLTSIEHGRAESNLGTACLVLGALLALAVNVRAIWRAVGSVFFDLVRMARPQEVTLPKGVANPGIRSSVK